jgi:Tetratricopeptide repeat
MAREHGYQLFEGKALTTLAGIDLDLDQPDQAREHAEQALALHRVTGQRLGQARTLVILGHALRRTDGSQAALPCWQEALALFTECGSPEADQVWALLRGAEDRPSTTTGETGGH